MEPRAKGELGSVKLCLHAFSEGTKLRCLLEDENNWGSFAEDVPKAEHFGDLITADHKVLSEESESRNNHGYAVVVQDTATVDTIIPA